MKKIIILLCLGGEAGEAGEVAPFLTNTAGHDSRSSGIRMGLMLCSYIYLNMPFPVCYIVFEYILMKTSCHKIRTTRYSAEYMILI